MPNLTSGKKIDGQMARAIRLGQKASVRAIAARAGISAHELSMIELGKRGSSSPYVVTKLAAVLRVHPSVITIAP